MTEYNSGAHCVYHHRYHIVWSTKYRYKVLEGDIRLRARDIIRQTCEELGVGIIKGVLARDHVHMNSPEFAGGFLVDFSYSVNSSCFRCA